MAQQYYPGNLVKARGRTWIVQPGSSENWLRLRPPGGADGDDIAIDPDLEIDPVGAALFDGPDPEKCGAWTSARLMYDALRFQLKAGAGPFRSFASIAVEPRPYQLVPFMMAMRQKTVRLLIADEVGVGKTIESGIILRELMDRGEIRKFAVLCPPHLVEQWIAELRVHFNIHAEAVTTATAARLERNLSYGKTLFDHYEALVISLDYIKTARHRSSFLSHAPECLIVDEAHTCTNTGTARQQRFALLKELSADRQRHMMLLTATPHSGNDEAFYNMLSLLDPAFLQLKNRTGADDPLRRRLAQHFVQRRRQDIEKWQKDAQGNIVFPVREVAEDSYQLSDAWLELFDRVQEYCRRLASTLDSVDEQRKSMIWYVILALYRCISSSPQAALEALRRRLEKAAPEQLAEDYRCQVADGDEDEMAMDDLVPAAGLEETAELQSLIDTVSQRISAGDDPKYKLALRRIRELLENGWNPVIFCRYIATAQYLAGKLKADLEKGIEVACITGELPPEERIERVNGLREKERRVLVATDCLSEGVNLQELFTAVVHYDLSWNPTRHDQREGRVDRFGQQADKVRCLLIYGANNPVDGFIMQVILRKSQTIREKLGITVPVPENSERISQALIQAALFKDNFKKKNVYEQGELFDTASFARLEKQMELDWQNQQEKVKRTRTIFAQNTIRPEEVMTLWEKQQEVLGGNRDMGWFCRQGIATLGYRLESAGGQGTNKESMIRVPCQTFDEALRSRLENQGIHENTLIDLARLHRSSPLVFVIAEGLMQMAMQGDNERFRRCAVGTSADIDVRTVIALVRNRYRIQLRYRNEDRGVILAEEVVPVAFTSRRGELHLSDDAAVTRLLDVAVSQNIDYQTMQNEMARATNMLAGRTADLEKLAHDRAEELLEDHQRVRNYTEGGHAASITPVLPCDIMGLFVLLPE